MTSEGIEFHVIAVDPDDIVANIYEALTAT